MSQISSFPVSQLFVMELEGSYRQAQPCEVVAAALDLVEAQVQRGFVLTSPSAAREYLAVRLGGLEHEVFAVVFLDAQNRVIEYQEMFRGTVSQTAVYPREIVKAALALNAVGAILVHNHPSGSTEPSRADEYLTQTVKTALALVDVRVNDHLLIAGSGVVSFAERGLLAKGRKTRPFVSSVRRDRNVGGEPAQLPRRGPVLPSLSRYLMAIGACICGAAA